MINIPKGTKDMLPSEAYKWHFVEDAAKRMAERYGYKEIRTPMFEYTELFSRGVGETTDVVTKEMYTFEDKGGRSVTLRPEGTAGVARCFIENGLQQGVMPMKAYYIASVFRYEKPQNGRLREHHQFGVECYGSYGPAADAEVIALANDVLKEVGVTELELNLNSIGCPECRASYNVALRNYIAAHIDDMCPQCKARFEKNPLRILDCKEEKCRKIAAGAPIISDFLCDDCKEHFAKLKDMLDIMGIKYVVNPYLVRGLDYYTRTVFEFVSTAIGAQGTVCGGGRYDNLVEEVGGKSTPAVGFGMGLERLLLLLENTNSLNAEEKNIKIYIAPVGAAAAKFAMGYVRMLRTIGVSAETDIMDRSVKAQMKYADRRGAEFVAVIGDDELNKGACAVKNLRTGVETELSFEKLTEALRG